LVAEVIGEYVAAESFGVAVPEFDCTVHAILDDAAAVVVLELGDPAETTK
jgi:hypothetical protein